LLKKDGTFCKQISLLLLISLLNLLKGQLGDIGNWLCCNSFPLIELGEISESSFKS